MICCGLLSTHVFKKNDDNINADVHVHVCAHVHVHVNTSIICISTVMCTSLLFRSLSRDCVWLNNTLGVEIDRSLVPEVLNGTCRAPPPSVLTGSDISGAFTVTAGENVGAVDEETVRG